MFIDKNFKNRCKHQFFRKKFKKVCVLQRRVCNKSKFQTQLSQKLQRFRICRKNKKCSIFHDLFEYIIFSYDCKLLDWSFNQRRSSSKEAFSRLESARNRFLAQKNLRIDGFLIKIRKFDFRFNTPISLNQGQRSVSMLRECAQSIPRLEKPKNQRFSHKNPKMFDFRFNTPIFSLNQGQGSVSFPESGSRKVYRVRSIA